MVIKMPELPEVQTVVNGLKPIIIGKKITKIRPIWHKVLENFSENTINNVAKAHRIYNVTRRAKFIILHLEGKILAIHLRMTGKLFLTKENQIPVHCTAVMFLEGGESLIFQDTRKFGRMYLYADMSIIDSRHGLEPLEKDFTERWLIQGLKFRNRNIKSLLLDQSFISGLGNIYVDESLWYAGIHPLSKSNAIPLPNIKKLRLGIIIILQKAIKFRGTTIIDFSFLNGESGRYSKELRVFGRNKKTCDECSEIISKTRVAGRGTYVCTSCQKIFS
tara:strand:+ start:30007 stop:30834 length:828 start_codon:yes stop_codon:yes gene_type:complete